MDNQDKIFDIADKITKYNFPAIWEIEKQPLETLTKKEVAEEMFFKGIAYILDHLDNLKEINIQKLQQKLKEIV